MEILYYYISVFLYFMCAKIYKNINIQKYFEKNLVVSMFFCNFAAENSDFACNRRDF